MEAGAGRVPADDAGHCWQTLLKRPDRRQGEGGSSQGGTAKEQQAVAAGSTGEMLLGNGRGEEQESLHGDSSETGGFPYLEVLKG